MVAQRKMRFTMTVAAVGLVVLLFVLVTSAIEGMMLTFVSHHEHTDADVWVLPPSENTMGTPLDRELADELRSIEGVARVDRGFQVPAYAEHAETETQVIVSGYESGHLTEPYPLVEGGLSARDGTNGLTPGVVVDRTLVFANPDLELGDVVSIAGEVFEISGFTEGHQLFASYPVVFVRFDDLNLGVDLREEASYFLVRVDGTEDARHVAGRIEERISGVTAYAKEPYMEKLLVDYEYAQILLYALQFVTAAIGTLIVGVTVYTAVLERLREFGIIKAIGGTRAFLLRLVMLDGIMLAVPGFVAGALLAAVAVSVLPSVLPVRFEHDPAVFAAAGAVALGVSLLGSAFGVRHAVGVDPLVAIRGR